MASLKFEGGKCHNAGEAKALFRHNKKDSREHHRHSNQDIDLTKTKLNTSLHGYTYSQICKIYDDRIEQLESEYADKHGRAMRKDAVRMYGLELPIPADIPEDRQDEFVSDVCAGLNDYYGAEIVIDADIHRDEIHPYLDAETGEERMSMTHAHISTFPLIDGELKAKQFSSRKNMIQLNKNIDQLCRTKYGCRFMDGSGKKSTKSVEQLKNESDKKAREVQNLEQKLLEEWKQKLASIPIQDRKFLKADRERTAYQRYLVQHGLDPQEALQVLDDTEAQLKQARKELKGLRRGRDSQQQKGGR